MRYLLMILGCLGLLTAHAQRSVDTTLATDDGSNPIMRAIITVPAWYGNNISTDSGQAIIYCGGLGEVGTDSSKVATYGPHNYMRTVGWDGGVNLSGVMHYPLIISLQVPAGFWVSPHVGHIIDLILANYRIMRRSVHWLGISMGGWEGAQVMSYRATSTDSTFLNYFRSMVDIEGVRPDDANGAAAAYPLKFIPTAKKPIPFYFFEQLNDFRDGQTIVNTMNGANANIAFWISTNYNGGLHGQWQFEMGGNGVTTPLTYSFNGGPAMNVYQWMLRNGDTVHDLHAGGTPPVCSAGPPQQIQLPASTATLTGTASASGGATISTTTWSCEANPGAAVITSPSSLTTGITGMTTWGNYVFRLIATDNNNLHDTAYVRVNVVPACNVSAKVKYFLTGSGGGIFFPNGNLTQPWRGGDTLVLPNSGTASNIIFGNLSGDLCNPIVIMAPATGQAFTGILRLDDHCQYIKVTGMGSNTNKFGILASAAGMGLGNHIEMDSVEINGLPIHGQGATGVICKRHIDTFSNGIIVPETAYPSYQMTKYRFHHMYVHNSDGEGWYIGPSAPNGGDGQGPTGFFPVRMDSVRIDHNFTDSTGWDGIQLSGALDGDSIDHNLVTHYGLVDMSSQQAGVIGGSSCHTDIFADTIINGTGNGLQNFGYSLNFIHDLIMDSCGRDGTPSGQATIFQNDIPSIVESHPGQKTLYSNLLILHPQTFGAIRIQNDRGTGLVDTIRSSTFCIPGANIGTWQGLYIITFPTAVTSSLTLSTTCGLTPPTVSAGSNQFTRVPAPPVTVTGTATGNGGATITSTTWSLISGPGSPVITTPNSLTTTITGLQLGTYVFQLAATDSNSLTNQSSVTVTVLASNSKLLRRVPFRFLFK